MADIYSLYRMVTLKIRSRSPKSNQLFPSSKHCIYASLVKIHSLIQKIMHVNLFWTFQSACVILKIRSRSPKSNQLFPSSQQCIYAGFIKIHPLVHRRLETLFWTFQCVSVALKIRSWSDQVTKIKSTLPLLSKCIYAGLVKINPLVQKITDGNHISEISKCRCDLENKIKVTKICKSCFSS